MLWIHSRLFAVAGALALALAFAAAQEPTKEKEKGKTKEYGTATDTKKTQEQKQPTSTATQEKGAAANVTFDAMLVDQEAKAQKKEATVEVKVKGVRIVDPAAAKLQPRKGQGHFHYRIDDGPVIATTANKLSFHELSSGQHKITVILAGNDHTPLGPEKTLNVTVP